MKDRDDGDPQGLIPGGPDPDITVEPDDQPTIIPGPAEETPPPHPEAPHPEAAHSETPYSETPYSETLHSEAALDGDPAATAPPVGLPPSAQVIALGLFGVACFLIGVGAGSAVDLWSVLGVPFGGVTLVVILRLATFWSGQDPWDWHAVLDWRSALVAVGVHIWAVATPDLTPETWPSFTLLTVVVTAVAFMMAVYEGKVATRSQKLLVSSCAMFFVLVLSLFADYTANFVELSLSLSS